ncbi:Oidioi.mRNA.OKI2018_I69.XSR.g16331.t1.cds [Oikopleura dioica]|uniref:Oidioi.mRNA.OKI2018_I69.XSR.g16331.t1.cds n=1 Tax=Oikopleura dioica TaxID=34765 RepID=A0ABN7SN30_OIKDI|nr:Oidioi.mRNA.OKI2018_I69.XSR.g16331.t1.cds [Oikopleura dioica]
MRMVRKSAKEESGYRSAINFILLRTEEDKEEDSSRNRSRRCRNVPGSSGTEIMREDQSQDVSTASCCR